MQNAEQTPITPLVNTPEEERAMYPFLTPEERASWIAAKKLGRTITASINATVDGTIYTSRIDIGSYWKLNGERAAVCVPDRSIFLDPVKTQRIALFIWQNFPEVYAAIVEANEGTEPPIEPAYVPQAPAIDEQ